tara:strand:- start:644 stop:1432 length:789 start_codon:yes stop_codon:yes gene_type:complete
MTQSTKNKSSETPRADYKPSAGILSINQAAEFLRCDPLQVQRAIAFGNLPDTRDSKGSIVFQADAERFIGQGRPNIDSPEFASGWFKPSRGEVNRVAFQSKIRAAGASLGKVTDEQLKAAFHANRRKTSFRFGALPTEAMRAVFDKKQSSGFGASDTLLTFGEAALATGIRDAARRKVRQMKVSFAEGMESDITKLYASPERFKHVFAQSLSGSLTELAVTFEESRSIEGRSGPVRVFQVVPFAAFSSGLELNAARLLHLAF